MSFSQKEMNLLKDLQAYESTSVTKYGDYAGRACDGELKNLFSSIRQTQQHHLDTLNGMIGNSGSCGCDSGTCPIETSSAGASCDGSTDQFLCQDALRTEKYASSLYDTCLFEFADQASRDTLNHIQREEQQNGKQLYDYMNAHGMMA